MEAEHERRHDSTSRNENESVTGSETLAQSTRRRHILPADALIIVPVREMVLFPGLVVPINIGRPRSIAAAQEATHFGSQVGVVLQRDVDADDPQPDQLHRVGTVGIILRYVTVQDDSHYIVCQGDQRFGIVEFLRSISKPGSAWMRGSVNFCCASN